MYRVFSFLLLALASFTLGACSSTTAQEGKPLPDMTFEHVVPVSVDVATIEIMNQFEPGQDIKDVSTSFPTPPDLALQRFAENRLDATGSKGVLKFIIQDIHVHHAIVEKSKGVMNWMGLDRKDRYDVEMVLRLFKVTDQGQELPHSVLTLNRSIAIPQSYSLAKKEQEQFKFVELLVQDADAAILKTLEQKMDLVEPVAFSQSTHTKILVDSDDGAEQNPGSEPAARAPLAAPESW